MLKASQNRFKLHVSTIALQSYGNKAFKQVLAYFKEVSLNNLTEMGSA